MAKDTLYCVKLRDGNTRMTCWVDRQVPVGSRITLKNSGDPSRWWTVEWAGEELGTRDSVVKGWKVGGL